MVSMLAAYAWYCAYDPRAALKSDCVFLSLPMLNCQWSLPSLDTFVSATETVTANWMQSIRKWLSLFWFIFSYFTNVRKTKQNIALCYNISNIEDNCRLIPATETVKSHSRYAATGAMRLPIIDRANKADKQKKKKDRETPNGISDALWRSKDGMDNTCDATDISIADSW